VPRAGELQVLASIAEALNSSPGVQEALERSLALVAELLGLDTGWVWLRDAESGAFYSAAARNLPPYLREPVRMTGASCWCLDAFEKGTLTPTNIRLIHCSRLLPAVEAHDTEATRGLCCHASLPISFQGRSLGVLNVAGPQWRKLTRPELRLLATIAYQLGIAVERARLAEGNVRLARAEERARLAREIHDTLAQGLTAITLQLESALANLETDPSRTRTRVESALETARNSLDEARRSVEGLRAAPLAGRSLPEALLALARGFASGTGVRVRPALRGHVFEAGPLPPMPLRLEAELYRIAQEALANVRRHAAATRVVMVLQAVRPAAEVPERLRLFLHDDGRGFDPGAPAAGRGLLGMTERAAVLGGSLRVKSTPGRGTLVLADVPWPAEDES
jgi:two-component system, NarL family, sensor kinase